MEFTWGEPYGDGTTTTYQFEEGMTWAEFVVSDYNDGSFCFEFETEGVMNSSYGPFGVGDNDLIEAKQYP